MRSVLNIISIIIVAIIGAMLGFPIADFLKPYLADIYLWITKAIMLISLLFVDELSWASVLDNSYDFLFVFKNQFPSLVFYIKNPPVIFYIILILYEILWINFYLSWVRKNENL